MQKGTFGCLFFVGIEYDFCAKNVGGLAIVVTVNRAGGNGGVG
jgi:hypothetical protein